MSVAPTVVQALEFKGVDYTLVDHPHTVTSAGSAHAAHVDARRVAKAVLLKDERGFVLAVLPASDAVDVAALGRMLHRTLQLASEDEVSDAFYDCERGAVPAVGEEYQIPTVVDESLRQMADVFFEAGDHERLVHVSAEGFSRLMEQAEFMPVSARRD